MLVVTKLPKFSCPLTLSGIDGSGMGRGEGRGGRREGEQEHP